MKLLKLNKLENNQLSKKEKKEIVGGAYNMCSCGCKYADSGGSSTSGNLAANVRGGLTSPGIPKTLYFYNGNATYDIGGQSV